MLGFGALNGGARRACWPPLATLVLACAQGGCTSLDGLQLATTADDGGVTGCVHAEIPRFPLLTAAEQPLLEFVVAVRAVDLGERDEGDSTERYRSMGFDLDSTCTGLGEGPSCWKPTWVTADDIDGPQGRDNAFGAMQYRYTADGGPSPTASANDGTESGVITTVIRVRGYNGTSVDTSVDVAVFAGTMNGGGQTSARPEWSGQDTWAAYGQWVNTDPSGMPNLDHPRYFDANAYVTNWILVAQLDHLAVPYRVLSQVKLTARIVSQDNSWFLVDGTVAGRVHTDHLLWPLDTLKDPLTLGPLCTDSPSYLAIKQAICASSDISYSGPDDGSAPCDAMSVAWEFTAEPAHLDGIQAQPRDDRPCPPETTTVNDSCSTLE